MDLNVLLPALVLIPLLSAIPLLAPIPAFQKAANVKIWALTSTLVSLLLSWYAATRFDWDATHLIQGMSTWHWVEGFGLSFSFGVDSISLWLVLLTTFLMPITVLGSFSAVEQRPREFYLWLLVLQAAMVGTFVARDIVFFYICFEFTLIPLYFLIGIFGSSQRLRAARVFFLYTFTGSMLTLAGLIYVAFVHAQGGAWSFDISDLTATAQQLSTTEQTWVLLALLAGFAVKVPIFPVHTWLPLAHTEAPTSGSVILAGVLLKLGTYGLLRFALPMTPEATVALAPWIATLAIIGILYTALICWVQKDIKKLIAYSSVSHLGFCVLGLFALNGIGVSGSIMYMVNHGLSTGALFLCIGMIYERLHTREMRQFSGLARTMPVWSCFMIFFCLASVGLPGLNGFVGEFLTLMGAFTATDVLGPAYASIAALGMIIGAMYLLYMIGKVIWGPVKLPDLHAHGDAAPAHAQPDHSHGHRDGAHAITDLNIREIATLVPLAIACLWLGVYPRCVLDTLEIPVAAIVQPAENVIAASDGAVLTIDDAVAGPHQASDRQAEHAMHAASDAGRLAAASATPAPFVQLADPLTHHEPGTHAR